jgi:hypothetical protein
MGITVEVLRREFKQFGIFERFHLMDHAWRHVHALAGRHFELIDQFGIHRLLYSNPEPPCAEIERFGLELMKVQRAFMAFSDFQDLATVQTVVGDPYFAAPPFWLNVNWLPCTVHKATHPPGATYSRSQHYV